LNLQRDFVPQLQWEFAISCGKSSNEGILEGLNSSLSSIHSIVVWFNKLKLALLLSEECFDVLGDWLSMMFILGLNLFEMRLSICVLYALKMLLPSRPEIGMVNIAFAL
jgi:hypothetical protein